MFKFPLLILSVALFSLQLNAQMKSGKMPPKTPPAIDLAEVLKYESVPGDPLNTRIHTLKNGMKVYLSVYKNAPRIQTYIAVKAGSKNDPSNATGLAHYLEHMVFKGTDVYGTKDYAKESVEIKKIEELYETYRLTRNEQERKVLYHRIDSISGVAAKYAIANEYDKMLAGIGADGTNAYTSFDQTVYVNDIPSNQISNWLRIEAERFRNPVLRLFHTELEAVYEEKNIGMDNDNRKVFEALFEALFKKHTYGTQTTIGTIEHLKNPSMVEINNYYKKNYVPNNMAIVMSGDFDPDQVILEVNKYFGPQMPSKVEPYTFEPETPITSKISKTVVGPSAESVTMAWRLKGEGSRDADMGTLISAILNNGTAGLMDINLNQAQKVLSSYSFYYPLKDYSILAFGGEAKEGQKLEEVETLLLSQMELVKKGEFPDWLLKAVITDLKLRKTKELESNASRADMMLNAFVNDLNWKQQVEAIDRMSKITKQELVDFAKQNFSNANYAVIYKLTGVDSTVQKVEKPQITPVEVDRENSSDFVKAMNKSLPSPIAPRFLDYKTDIAFGKLKSGVEVLHNTNTENKLFDVYYRFEMGSNHNKQLPLAIKAIPYLATEGLSAAAVKEELYKLGCTFNVFVDQENVWVSISGLDENFEKALQLFEKILAKPLLDKEVLKNLVSDMIKERNDNKLQKRLILNRAMSNYARYGAVNPFNYVLSDEELNALKTEDITQLITSLSSYQHNILSYSPRDLNSMVTLLNKHHKIKGPLKPVPAPYAFKELKLDKKVFVAEYDMKQAEIVTLSNGEAYDVSKVPVITLYNNYFGGGMSSIMFQDLRESKALAYSTFSRYNPPNKLSKTYFNFSYIGSQADKLEEALNGLFALLNEMPKSQSSFDAAKESILQEIRTQRITKAAILFDYVAAKDLGNTIDMRKPVFEKVQNLGFDDIKAFHESLIKNKATTLLVLAKKENLDLKVLEKYGEVKFLSLTELFGY